MQFFHSRRQFLITAAFVAVLVLGGVAWRKLTHDDGMAFLPARAGASWILDNKEPEASAHYSAPLLTQFKRTFILVTPSPEATVTLCVFKTATVTINGREVTGINLTGKNWKAPVTASIGTLLQAGTNEIVVTVTNHFGPPALWLRLVAGNVSLGTDASWLTSPTGSHWLNAGLAAAPRPIPDWSQFNSRRYPADSIRQAAGELAGFAIMALVLIFGIGRYLKKGGAMAPEKLTGLLLAVIIVARVVLFFHTAPELLRAIGFDATEHTEYIQFIQQKKALPLPNDGWEMHQPPLYYLAAAGWLGAGGFSAGQADAVLPLRTFNLTIGLLQCWLVLLCLRRIFPASVPTQAAGLIIASFLPANLYLSMYVTNDPLAGLLVTLALYFFLRWNAAETGRPLIAAGIGLALGAAMLTKLSSLLAVPVFLAAMGLRLLARKNNRPRDWLGSVGIAGLVCVLACGWHYGRVWMQIGALPLPNSQTDPTSAWWQEPGYRTAAYYLHFGQSLGRPLFSGLNSFADGIYSTWWADGLIGGSSQLTTRPSWNYDLMNASCLFAAVLTLLGVIGLGLALYQWARKTEPLPLLLMGMIFSFIGGILLLTLHGPWLAHVKAFYALPALVPFCAFIAAGLVWLSQKNRIVGPVLWFVLLVWMFTAYGSFWVRSNNYEFWRNRAIVSLQKNDPSTAVADISRALKLNPDDADSHAVLADTLIQQGKGGEALGEYAEVLRLRPDSPVTLNAVAIMLSDVDKDAAIHAERLATRACELTHYRQANFVSTLAAAQGKAGHIEEAITSAQIACELALQTKDETLFQKNRTLLEQYRQLKPSR